MDVSRQARQSCLFEISFHTSTWTSVTGSEPSARHVVHWVRWRHDHRHVLHGRSRLDVDHLDDDGGSLQVPQLAVQLTPAAPDTETGDGDVLAEGAL